MLLALTLFGSILWARSKDPFFRSEFRLDLPQGGHLRGMAIRRYGGKQPVLIYFHDTGGSWVSDGNVLRQFAKFGIAAISVDYDEQNPKLFEDELSVTLSYVRKQDWAQHDAIAWVAFGLGGVRSFSYLFDHPEDQPKFYACLGGGTLPTFPSTHHATLKSRVLIVSGENDELFPFTQANSLFEFLRSIGTTVALHTLPGHGHDFRPDQAVIWRLVAEVCKATLTPKDPFPEPLKRCGYPFLLFVSPAVVWFSLGIFKFSRSRVDAVPPSFTKQFLKGLRLAAISLSIVALSDAIIHWLPPQMTVNSGSLFAARAILLPPCWSEDFEKLTALRIWQGQKLSTLIEHVELANYTVRELVNWPVQQSIYGDFVPSPIIAPRER